MLLTFILVLPFLYTFYLFFGANVFLINKKFVLNCSQSVNEKKVAFKMEEIKPVAPSRQGPAIIRDTKPVPKKEMYVSCIYLCF